MNRSSKLTQEDIYMSQKMLSQLLVFKMLTRRQLFKKTKKQRVKLLNLCQSCTKILLRSFSCRSLSLTTATMSLKLWGNKILARAVISTRAVANETAQSTRAKATLTAVAIQPAWPISKKVGTNKVLDRLVNHKLLETLSL